MPSELTEIEFSLDDVIGGRPLTRATVNACRLNRLGREDFLLGGSILIAGSH
jgi:hypothetical protein